jgi:hypothetical protein
MAWAQAQDAFLIVLRLIPFAHLHHPSNYTGTSKHHVHMHGIA